MASSSRSKLRVAFVHPDLGIGGAERLVVDAALGLKKLGHEVDIYTSHHDPTHCFTETKDGTLSVRPVHSFIPRTISGKFHILLAHLRQLYLTAHLLRPWNNEKYDVFFVDQLSTCIPFIRGFGAGRVVFYCHFPDKLLANGEYVEDPYKRKSKVEEGGTMKAAYRKPMDWLEERTTSASDIILANSQFTAKVFKEEFPTIEQTPSIVYPGINISAYETAVDTTDPDVIRVTSSIPTFLSLNRFEKKKNINLAIKTFSLLRQSITAESHPHLASNRLIIAGGYDPRIEDNLMTLVELIDVANACKLKYDIIKPAASTINIPPFNTTPSNPDVLFLLNFTSAQRTALLTAKESIALLYTPANEHFGIGPVEAMSCGLPVIACNSGGPTESIVDDDSGKKRTGWLRPPAPEGWRDALLEVVNLTKGEREALSVRSKARARELFGMEAMAKGIESALFEAVKKGPVGINTSIWVMLFGFVIAFLAGTLFI